MKIAIIVGTRPEIIKMAPVIRECINRGIDYFVIHSNQHYSEEMDSIFFRDLKLPKPNYNLGVGSGLHSNQTGNILIKMEPILISEQPDIVLVQGDTNTVLAGALAASKLGIKVGHVEAGLRSYDRTMPEETNRIMTDHISDFLFAVGPNQESILKSEGIDHSKIFTVGNTVSDSLFQHLEISKQTSNILTELALESQKFFLVTAHRAANVDVPEHLRELLEIFDKLHSKYNQNVVWPIHPRTRLKLEEFEIKVPPYLKLIKPVGYLDFLQLQKHALLILTDSGGIQEEACLLGVPCITLRENTERPESVEVGANILVGRDANKAIAAAESWLAAEKVTWNNPFGDGQVAEYILNIVTGKSETPIVKTQARPEKVTVIGMGYMGLPIASLIAQAGYHVAGVDLNQTKIDLINKGKCPFDEVGMPELVEKVVKSGKLTATTAISMGDIYLIAVPTPHNGKACDTSYVFSAVDGIIPVAKDGQIVIIESTISPRTAISVEERFAKAGINVHVVHCPERAIPGQTLFELVNNDRIIGATDKNAQLKVKRFYQSFVKGDIFLTTLTTAECIKLVENTSRDVGIAFANELAEICEELDVDVHTVIKLANKHPRVNVLSPGPGVGGHCIPIDPWFLVEKTKAGDLVRLARAINDERPNIVAKQAIELLNKVQGKNIGILGVTYKANVDDCRESPADAVYSYFSEQKINTMFHDPHVNEWHCSKAGTISELEEWADVLILLTDHVCYENIQVSIPMINTRS